MQKLDDSIQFNCVVRCVLRSRSPSRSSPVESIVELNQIKSMARHATTQKGKRRVCKIRYHAKRFKGEVVGKDEWNGLTIPRKLWVTLQKVVCMVWAMKIGERCCFAIIFGGGLQ